MTPSGSDEPSFDPRTWAGSKADKATGGPGDAAKGSGPAAPGADGDSFDPKSWRSASATASSAKPMPIAPLQIAAAAIIVLLIGGGAGFALWSGQNHHSVKVVKLGKVDETYAPPPGAERRSLTLAGPQDLPGALASAGVAAPDAQAAVQAADGLLGTAPGDLTLVLTLQPAGTGFQLARLETRRADGTGAILTRQSDGRFAAQAAGANLTDQVKVVRGEMDVNSFYSSAVAAGVTDELIPGFAQAFAFDFDFQREIKAGDVFEAAFDQHTNANGEVVGPQKLLFVSLETQAKSRALYWFQPQGQPGGWYDGNGRSIVRSLMRTPVEGAHITSPFGLRLHPILGFMKMHNGTDFAAPVGTPIYAAGDAIVEFSGPKGPDGNFVRLRHPNGWQTLYLHMNAIEPNVVAGGHVSQSQQIGQVGATGVDSAGHSTVTGPHLHYEVHINNVPVDPMSIPVDAGQALTGDQLQAFIKERNRIDVLRASQNG
jgi:murein DD-endopeptidase MepM/ murein hydrolase activator NlpD